MRPERARKSPVQSGGSRTGLRGTRPWLSAREERSAEAAERSVRHVTLSPACYLGTSTAAWHWSSQGNVLMPLGAADQVSLTEERAMADLTAEKIRKRAHELWEQAGKPEGRDEEFWHLAEQEIRNEDGSSPLRTPDNL